MSQKKSKALVDFSNTQIAFANKSDKQLKKASQLFSLMNKSTLVNLGSKLGLMAVKLNLPFTKSIIRGTIFEHFCGGENLLDCQESINELYKNDALTVLDYGAESKSSEEDLDQVMEENIRAIDFAAANNSVPLICTKVTGLAPNDLLINIQKGNKLTKKEEQDLSKLIDRLDAICSRGHKLDVGIFVDAEESWMQDSIDALVNDLMEKYNQEKIIVYNTFQLYRKDRLDYLKESHARAQEKGYILGAKIVRGAYMNKERAAAEEHGYESPIHNTKEDTDNDYNAAIRYCVENYKTIASCNATHNLESSLLQAQLISELGCKKNHKHLNFCQLYGMSDYITFNLSEAGYNVGKYLVYGKIKEVIPYLIRRAQENTSVTGEMSRELALIDKEMKRRGI